MANEQSLKAENKVWKQETFTNEKGTFTIFYDLCKGCGLCIEKCPTQVIYWSDTLGFMGTPAVNPRMEGCIVCGICELVCPEPAISIINNKKKRTPIQDNTPSNDKKS
ncbi:MAG: 4Fe-4S binding protein [Clostridia bacterium]|jgi:2-oxoglutarate ferredoxin oxidoreductase subunit delta|nr:4Fe-4S binding protein [Clostridia bacterium]